MKKSAFTKILKNENFLRLWSTQIFSQVTAYLLNYVLMIRIYQATGSTTALSLFLLVYTAPSIFLGLFSGAFIDLWSKRKVLLYSSLSQAIIALLYLGIGNNIWPIFGIVFLYSLCDEFFVPAQAATLPALVEKEALPIANSLFLFTTQASVITGSVLGGPIERYVSPQAPFFLASFFLLLGVSAAYFLPRDKPQKTNGGKFEQRIEKLVKDIGEGYRFIREKPRVFFPFLFYVFSQILIFTSIILFPSITSQVFKIDVSNAGIAVLLPVGIGALVGSLYLTQKIKVWGRKNLISAGWLISGLCFLIAAIVLPRVPFTVLLGPAIFAFLGVGAVLVIVTSLTMIQENTPEDIRGRVFGALNALMIIGAYLPVFFLAAITDLFGVLTTLFLIGLTITTIGIISFRVNRKYVLRTSHRT